MTLVTVLSLIHSRKYQEENHEQRTVEIIKNESTEVNKVLREVDEQLPGKISDFFETESEESDSPSPYLTGIVSSQLDADRFDYLLRDSYATGTNYGQFDLNWLIQHLFIDEEKGRFYLSKKAFTAAEAYIFARFHMYQTVYFHKATRAAEIMLRLAFMRYRDLLSLKKTPIEKCVLYLKRLFRFLTLFRIQKMQLHDYLLLDDNTILEFLKVCGEADDSILKEISQGLLNRRLYKCVDATDADKDDVGHFTMQVAQFLSGKGSKMPYTFINDSPKDIPYKLYDPDEEKPTSEIYVEMTTGERVEISKQSSLIAQLKDKYTLFRYYFPDEYRNEIDKIAQITLRKDR